MPLLVPTHWMNEALFPTLISLTRGVWVPGTPRLLLSTAFMPQGQPHHLSRAPVQGFRVCSFWSLWGTDFECLLPGS